MKFLLWLFLVSLPAFAQGTLSLQCPSPAKFNQAAVCTLQLTGTAAALQWQLTTNPAVKLAVTTSVAGKSLASNGGIYILSGITAANLPAGTAATVTIPAHSGTVTLMLSNIVGSSATGHAVAVTPGVAVSVQ